jgi:hypothetical protein
MTDISVPPPPPPTTTTPLRTLAHSGNFEAPGVRKTASASPHKQASARIRRPRQQTANVTTALPPLLPRLLPGDVDDDDSD